MPLGLVKAMFLVPMVVEWQRAQHHVMLQFTGNAVRSATLQRILPAAGAIALAIGPPHPAWADAFQVFCTGNSDGTTTCTGWQGGETLTCVNNLGGTSSCSTTSGRSFVCVREPDGVATCNSGNGTAAIERPLGTGTDCTFTGQGNFTCTPQRRRPSNPIGAPVIIDQPPLITPGVDFDLIRPLTP